MSERLTLDSIAFDTFGWAMVQSDDSMRVWEGDGVVLIANFFPQPPDIGPLEPDAIRREYESQPDRTDTRRGDVLRRIKRREGERTRKIIDLTVSQDGPVPIVRTMLRLPFPERYLYSASLLLPVAECSWVFQAQSPEAGLTGLRESVALMALHEERSAAGDSASLTDLMADFDPYDARWDGLVEDPLTLIRRRIELVERSLHFAPSVLEAAPYEW